jgi:hypothetical protein
MKGAIAALFTFPLKTTIFDKPEKRKHPTKVKDRVWEAQLLPCAMFLVMLIT